MTTGYRMGTTISNIAQTSMMHPRITYMQRILPMMSTGGRERTPIIIPKTIPMTLSELRW
jgi:hypothetical protein